MTTKNTTTAETRTAAEWEAIHAAAAREADLEGLNGEAARTAAVNNTPAALKQTKAHFVLNEYPGLSEALLRSLGGSSEEKTAARNA